MTMQAFFDRLAVAAGSDTCPCEDFPEIADHPEVGQVVEAATAELFAGLQTRVGDEITAAVMGDGMAVSAVRHALVIVGAAAYAAGLDAAHEATTGLDEIAWDSVPTAWLDDDDEGEGMPRD